ncbi:MAG: Gfo/Idh/MocA family oxidoreductase [Melioribacteraceae bacterium]|nr:Gfo/Idh/MocA family oxidoreductase [Melioribacteraceae bacterium]MCF8353520.1 Gfo/Idh/MocA family oxidoreductase [Melioribacteraceae bacterium]MCF8392546.1 Gfo/Idh/MocA family oxidoreductase [Melioribacteraceae bacterium]MCF8418439.1 Gfo/Idh/MocA family oxidoreductase [Melioribacteraceae bacterium]
MKRIKTAVIGSGFMGSAHVEALQRIGGVEVAAISSNDVDAANEIQDRFSIEKFYEDWHDVMKDEEIEVVHNCTPNFLHFEINKAAINSGKHILSEKPLTMTSLESEELLSLLKSNNVVNGINFNYRFYPLIQNARVEVEKGNLGEIFLVHGNYLQDWLFFDTDYNWRLETEQSGYSRAIADIGSHWCDMAQFVTGQKIKRVFANLVTIHQKRKKPVVNVATFKGKEESGSIDYNEITVNTEDAGSVLIEFESGTHGVFTVSQVSAGRKNHFSFEIDGSKKAVSWNQERPNEMWIGYREKPNEIIIKDPALIDKSVRKYAHYPGGHPEGYPDGPKNLFNNFYQFIRDGKDPQKDQTDFPTFADGHIENKIVEAILKSNKEQKWVEVD